jgi:hypothetical protein
VLDGCGGPSGVLVGSEGFWGVLVGVGEGSGACPGVLVGTVWPDRLWMGVAQATWFKLSSSMPVIKRNRATGRARREDMCVFIGLYPLGRVQTYDTV